MQNYSVVFGTLGISINAGFGTHEADIGIAGEKGGHSFVGTKTGLYGEVDALVLKISQFYCDVLRRIENRVSHLIQCYFGQLIGFVV